MSDLPTVKAREIVEATNSLNSCRFFTSKEPALRLLNAKVNLVAKALLTAKPAEKQELLVAVIKAQDAAQKSLSSNSFIARFFPAQQLARNKINFQGILSDSALKGNIELARLEIALETLETSSLLGKVEALENVTKKLEDIVFRGDVNPEYAIQCLALLQKAETIIQKLTGSRVDKRLFSDHITALKASIDSVAVRLKANQWDENPEVAIALLDFYILQFRNHVPSNERVAPLIAMMTACLGKLGVTFPEKDKEATTVVEFAGNIATSALRLGKNAVTSITQSSVLNGKQKEALKSELEKLSSFIGIEIQVSFSKRQLETFKGKLDLAIDQLTPLDQKIGSAAGKVRKDLFG